MLPRTQDDKEILATFLTTAPHLVPMSLNQDGVAPPEKKVFERQKFWIRLADTAERREKAALLVDQMYARKGYDHENIIHNTPHTITLISYARDGDVIGTITIGIDSKEEGLLADEGYREELDKLRAQGKKISEFNGLAIDSSVQSKLVVARLFHIAMLYPWGIFGHSDLVIEVTPVHARFYRRMLGFEQIGLERICPRVNTKGVLLHLSLDWASERIDAVGGLGDKAVDDKTLYPYFFGKADAVGILGRLKGMV
ncbi:MAG: N-acyl amino acid synthase FeeM domain-containing protein [Leptospirales bacterium]